MPWILFWLIVAGVFCTLYFRFINLRGMAQGMRIIRGDYDAPHHHGDTSHFQALATALSGTVGLGNIAGVAIAISLGGPGAVFWMWVIAAIGAASAFVESLLGQLYKVKTGDGYVGGGYVLDGWAYLVARWTRSPMQLIAPTTPTTMRTTLTAGSGKYAPAQL